MSDKSSINLEKSNTENNIQHNTRLSPPNYAIDDDTANEYNLNYTQALNLKNQIIQDARLAYETTKPKKAPNFKAKNYEWSAVVNIKPETTMAELEKLAEHFNKKYGFQCYQIAIHRDEGYLTTKDTPPKKLTSEIDFIRDKKTKKYYYLNEKKERVGELDITQFNKVINHHAHLEFITLDKQTGKQIFKMRDFNRQTMREIQTEVAEILQMERGQDKRISGAERVKPRQYAKEQAIKNKAENELEITKKELDSVKSELENAKKEKNLSKTAIKTAIKMAKVAWRNENAKRIEQGLAPIYTATHYNSNEYLKGLENGTYKNADEFQKALDELQKRIFKEYEQGKNATHRLTNTKKDFKSKLIDEFYSDLSTKHDLIPFYFNKELKTLENKQKGYKIKDSENALTLTTSKNADLSEQVAIILDMAKSKGWELSEVKISGSQAFCDEVARQIAEIKAKEKVEQERKIKAESQAQAQKIADLEKQNEQLKQELANKSAETALKTQNDTLNNKIQAQDLKTPENAQNEPKTKAENDLEILENMPNALWSKKQISTFLEIAKPLKIPDIQFELDYYSKKIQENVNKLGEPSSLSYVKTELKNIIAKEKAKSVGQEPQPKSISDDEKRKELQRKEIERPKEQGYFNSNSTNSQSKDTGIDFQQI